MLLGASGMIGSRLLDELVSRGHRVTAVVRNPAKIEGHENVTVTAGDIFDSKSIAEAAGGADAVISAYGPGPADPALLLAATRALIAGVEGSGMKRLIMVGGAGSLEVAPGVQLVDTPNFPAEWKAIALSHREALKLLKESSLDWTSASPAAYIHPGARTGKFRLDTDRLIVNEQGASELSAEDFSIAIADEAEKGQYIRRRFTAAW